jgi:hypothetical protein
MLVRIHNMEVTIQLTSDKSKPGVTRGRRATDPGKRVAGPPKKW